MILLDPRIYEAVRRPLLEAETLLLQKQISEESYWREVDTIFMQGWHFVGHVDYVPKPGDFHTVDFVDLVG